MARRKPDRLEDKPKFSLPKEAIVDPFSLSVAEACREVMSAEDCDELSKMERDYVLGEAFNLLLASGIDDPDAFLKDKGVLE